MLLLKISFDVFYEKEEEFRQVLNTLSSTLPSLNASQQMLNLKMQLSQHFSLVQEFKTREELREFLHGAVFRQLIGALTVLGTIRDAKVYTSSAVESLEEMVNFL